LLAENSEDRLWRGRPFRRYSSNLRENDTLPALFGNFTPSSFRKNCRERRVAVCYARAVKATPGTLQEGGASFATTHWSVVAQSALTDLPEAASALAQLCEMYWPPIYSFVRRRGYAPPDAQDLTQSFLAFFLRTKAYARTDPLQGKFRSFLLASVKHFLSDNFDRDRAIKRGGDYRFVSLDEEKAEAFYDVASASDSTAERLFELRWAKTLTAGALNSLRNELQVEGKVKLFEQLKNFLTGGGVLPSYDEAAARTGLPRATVKTHVHRLRQRYREIVRREIARTVSSPHEIDEELRHLCNVLAEAA
jgi:DNA-directed RNA polymerase specialized sigma24 family protein